MPRRSLTFQQACDYLRVPEQALRDAVKYGEVPSRRHGSEVYLDDVDLDTWGSRRILSLRLRDLIPEHLAATRRDVKEVAQDILLPGLLRPAYIELDARSKTRKSVIRDLVDQADALELLCDPADMLRQLEEREAFSSTALPGGIALLHPHHPDPYLIVEPFMLVSRNLRPVWFGAEDDTPTDLFCLVCCGENMRHLHVLARLCMMIRETSLLDGIRAAESVEALAETFYAAERDVLTRRY